MSVLFAIAMVLFAIEVAFVDIAMGVFCGTVRFVSY